MYPIRISYLNIGSYYQDISYNILTLLYQLFMKFMLVSGKLGTRELKWGDYDSHLDGAYNSSSFRLLVLK